jgi:hypothetical protein
VLETPLAARYLGAERLADSAPSAETTGMTAVVAPPAARAKRVAARARARHSKRATKSAGSGPRPTRQIGLEPLSA